MLALLFVLQTTAACADLADCRAQAQSAAARGDYEIFHDLAWRAVQKGPRNDTDLMSLLARAMALSGRYGDALVMLGRIADLGGQTDALTSPDFALVRQLKDWPAIEARLSGKPAPPSDPSLSAPTVAAAATTGTRAGDGGPDVLSFEGAALDPAALAHDAVSRRFLMADRRQKRLVIVDEISRHVVDYVTASSSSFLQNLTGLTIDARRGDLWVVSAPGQSPASSSALHKLQLVSGRTLADIAPPEGAGAASFVAVAVTPDGTVYALDGAEPRLYRLRPGARTLDLVMRLEARAPSALVAVDDRVIYVGTGQGLWRVDTASRAAVQVKSAEELTGLDSLAWRAGSLLAVQHAGDSYHVVRLALDSAGTRVQHRTVLATSPTPTVGTLARDAYYYLSDAGTIRRLSLR